MAMSIDVSNLLSLFSSVTGVDSLQLSESVEASSIEGFSEALIEQIELLQEQGQLSTDQQGLTELQELIGTEETEQLQDFAGLLNDYGKSKELVGETGGKLPLVSVLAKELKKGANKEINIEETIDTLQDVMEHIIAATGFVEEKAVEVTEVIEEAVAFLEGDSVSEEHQYLQEKIAPPLFSTQVEVPGNADTTTLSATDALVTDVLNNEALLQSTSAIQDQTIKSNIVEEQTNIQQVFSKELEKVASDQAAITNTVAEPKNIQQVFAKKIEKEKPVNAVSGNPVISVTNPDKVVEVVTDLEQEFLDDMLKDDQSMFKLGQENHMLDKAKQAEFDLNAFSAISSSAEKPVPNIAADISLLNRQILNSANEIKTEAPPMTRAFNHPQWQNEFSERIVWMHNKSIPAAELRLNPQHLGPISIRIDVSQDQATIGFTAQHAAVREAIEAAIPKLREMLNGQQLNLAEVNVSQQNHSEQKHPQGFFQNEQKQHNNEQGKNFSMDENRTENIENAAELTEEIERGRAVASNGLLNIYA